MTARGNFTPSGPRSRPAVDSVSANQFNHGFASFGGVGITLTDVKAHDVFGDGVSVARGDAVVGESVFGELSRDIRVTRLETDGTARQGVGVIEADGFVLEDSVIRDSWYTGVDLEMDVSGEQWGQVLHDVRILRNRFDGYLFAAITVPVAGITGRSTASRSGATSPTRRRTRASPRSKYGTG